MAIIKRLRLSLTGFVGGPGVITWYGLDAISLEGPMQDWWNALRPYIPDVVVGKVENAGDSIEDTTGALFGSWSGGSTAALPGSSAGAYSAASGVVTNWLTDSVLDGSRVRGKSFIVPLAGAAYDHAGTIDETALAAIRAAGVAAVTAAANNFCIWHRPFAGTPATATKPARAAHLGSHSLVTASRVPDKVAVLRSRRD